jgi:ClpP class serine protease
VIVPSNYDVEWAKDYITRGIIAPESYIRRAIDNYDKSKPMEVYINSPGGSVFSAYEIINALSAWQAETKQPINITVGAMAASAAAQAMGLPPEAAPEWF